MRVFLIGFMGCGKSRRGRELAAHLRYSFLDVDTEITWQTGMSVAEFFALHGETAFREKESDVLKSFDYPENCIVAVGGGLPCYFNNMEWMNAHGTTVYLEMEPAALISRLGNRQKRPLIKDMDDTQLLVFIEHTLKVRVPFYNQAQVIVAGLNLDTPALLAKLKL